MRSLNIIKCIMKWDFASTSNLGIKLVTVSSFHWLYGYDTSNHHSRYQFDTSIRIWCKVHYTHQYLFLWHQTSHLDLCHYENNLQVLVIVNTHYAQQNLLIIPLIRPADFNRYVRTCREFSILFFSEIFWVFFLWF